MTKADYGYRLGATVLVALRGHQKARLYYEVGADFAGFDAGAMREDFKIDAEHLTRWDQVAVVTDVDWIPNAVRLLGFLMPATTKCFSRSKSAQARVDLRRLIGPENESLDKN